MSENKICLTPQEFELLQLLNSTSGGGEVREVAKDLKKSYVEVIRVAQELSEKKLLTIEASTEKIIRLLPSGLKAATEGLPERIAVEKILKNGGSVELNRLQELLSVTSDELKIILGWLRAKNWVKIIKKDGGMILSAEKKPEESSDEKLLKYLMEKGEVSYEQLNSEFRKALEDLKRRKELVEVAPITYRYLKITQAGRSALLKEVEFKHEVTQLTPELIKTGGWRKAEFKKFDLESPVSRIYPGKLHPITLLIDEIREIFLEFGFEEIESPLVENTFWNFDVLFVPQDHPARDAWDTFYLKKPSRGNLRDSEIILNVKAAHENGWVTGSKGWGYTWDRSEAEKLILRTHTTAATIRYAATNPKPPKKVFCIDRVYRNERTDYRHLAEFTQIEGIIIDENASLRELLGFLKEFYNRLGFNKIRFRPGYFPFTEPSIEVDLYSDKLNQWIEMVGAGIFRPEVTAPLGVRTPILAWGMGFERLAMLRLDLNDVRILYRNDINWLRSIPSIIKKGI
ncbi:MAG: phenylalanine--tRNA ligase subunit alpha [Candidatus Odinarchaeum yellowstonii]|uniref:Phenylalanine--tRNA ligase alpha subunit n=1 Tax=Odinarchaeota yellowstonii (strain LCB_4) TaxID=1841599 RepID=A0AAF0D2Z6_ODILC|nr:MAG: phenylalanine--tRNA ligase subunit alpha [Candidatus Odinarchaeum yellowstonii]